MIGIGRRGAEPIVDRVRQVGSTRLSFQVRYFSVENAAAYRQSQAMPEEASKALELTRSRTFFARQFASPDGRDFALVMSYRSIAELDRSGQGFTPVQEKMVEMYGVAGLNEYPDLRAAAGITLMDAWQRVLRPVFIHGRAVELGHPHAT